MKARNWLARVEYGRAIHDVIETLLSLCRGPTLAILLAGIFWRRATGWGDFAGLTVGFCLTFVLNVLNAVSLSEAVSYLYVSFWSFWISLAVTVFVSLFTPPEPQRNYEALYMD